LNNKICIIKCKYSVILSTQIIIITNSRMPGLTNKVTLLPKVGSPKKIAFKSLGLPSDLVKHLYGDVNSDGKPNGKQPYRNGQITETNGIVYVPVHYLPTEEQFFIYSNFSNVKV
jgi:hypothetical protein